MKRLLLLATLLLALPASAQLVRITEKPSGLVYGTLVVPVQATEPVSRIVLLVNNVRWSEAAGRSVAFQVNLGHYIRRLRLRAVGYDAGGQEVAADEAVINDPQPPFRVRLQAPRELPSSGTFTLAATVIKPDHVAVSSIEYFVGEETVGTGPSTAIDASRFPNAVYARVVVKASDGSEANDVVFFGQRARAQVDVTLQHIPLSAADGRPLRLEDLRVIDEGVERQAEALTPAADQPLHVILMIDYSESMLEELDVVKNAAKQFARAVLTPRDRIAVVGFNQKTFWLTGYTNDWNAAVQAVDRVKPVGETHLYDSVVEMLFELQKTPGRHALVVLTDGVDQGSAFKLEHVVHYARYAGVPVYPIIKNKLLQKLMRFGVGQLQARRLVSLARDTGATYFIIRSERELPQVYARIAQELRQQYQLVFYAPPSAADEWRSLRIEARDGRPLRAPRGYFP
ncbi:MAG TPA: VWA domain-containing protein [Thermoanaerobaculia bacterium]|nr:VWA domain-containing protein [Thermoanaerobaculia bacterium]